jgi:WD40 repeat protein
MVKRLVYVVLCLVLVAGCVPIANPATPTTAPAATLVSTVTQSPVPPTLAPTATSAPTQTPLPTSTPEPTATPVPNPISAANADQLSLVRQYGGGQIMQVAWAPDGNQMIVLTSVQLIAYSPSSDTPQWRINTGTAQVQAVYSADGNLIVTHSAGGGVQVYDAASGKLLGVPIKSMDGIAFASLSNDGRYEVTSSTGSITTVWDASNGQKIVQNTGDAIPLGILDAIVSPDGSEFVTNGFGSNWNQQAQIWDTKTGKFLRGLNGINLDYVVQMNYSPDGKYIAGISRLALSSDINFTFVIWNASTGSLIKRVQFKDDIETYTFIPGEATAILSLSNGSLIPVNLTNGKLGTEFGSPRTATISAAVTSDGEQLAVAGTDGTIITLPLNKTSEVKKIKVDVSLGIAPYDYALMSINYVVRHQRKTGLGIAPDGKFVVVPSRDGASFDLVDPMSLKVLSSIGKAEYSFSAFDLSEDGSRLAAVEWGNLSVYDTASGRLIKYITTKHQYVIQQVLFSPDGKTVATLAGGRLGELFLWDIDSGKKVKTLSGSSTMSFSPDGHFLASDNLDFGVYLCDASSGKRISSTAADYIYSLDFSPDGKTIAIAGHEIHEKLKEPRYLVSFLNTATAKLMPMQFVGQPAEFSVVRYSPDGSLLATGDVHGNVRLWDVKSGGMVAQINEAAPGPLYLKFTPDGKSLILGSIDGTVRIYQAGKPSTGVIG